MSREQIFVKLNEIFRDVFDDEEITVTETTSAADIEGWDSLANINIIVSVENELTEIAGMKNVGEMADLIEERIGK